MNNKLEDIDISVIIPVFNAEKYISNCLESIINQSFKNLEIICINDGSTDGTLNILEEYSKNDNRIKVISKENEGQGIARNIGISQANGKYISFVDADDWIDLDAYKILHEYMVNNDLDVLFFQLINYINSSGNLVETDLYNHSFFKEDELLFNQEDYDDFLFNIPVCPVSKLYKTDFLKENNFNFQSDVIFEDNYFFYNMYFHAKRLGFIKKHFYYRRRHEESVTQNFNRNNFGIVKVTNRLLDLFCELNEYEKYKKDLVNHLFSMVEEWFLKCPLYLKEEFFQLIKENSKAIFDFKDDFICNLNKKYKKIYHVFIDSEDYIEFITKYKLIDLEWDSIDSVKKDYKISVVIPTYNTGDILHRTMNSIENQTLGFENIEVIIVDDNSNNETIDIINQYSTFENVKVIYLKSNTGAAGIPRNIGIEESCAEYVMFLDHDDFFKEDALEVLYDTINKYECDVVFGTYNSINNGNLTDIKYYGEKSGYFKSIYDNERLVAFPPPSIWTKLFRKDVIIKNNILFPPILGEDAIFLFKFLLNSNGIYYLNDSLICYHDLNKDSTTNNVSFNYLMEGLVSEKYLFNIFESINKEYYFKYRLEGNLNFFSSQFFNSNLDENEIRDILPIFNWFAEKGKYYNLSPFDFKNKLLFNSILQKDLFSIVKLKNNGGIRVEEESSEYLSRDMGKIKEYVIRKKIENEELKYKVDSYKGLFFKYKQLYEKSNEDLANNNVSKESFIKKFLKKF